MKPGASIQGRITLALGAIALTVFSSVAILLYLTLERELFRQETGNIAGKLDIALHFASEAESASSLPDLFHKLDDMLLGQGDIRLWIIDRDGKVLYGGTNAPAALEAEQGLAALSPGGSAGAATGGPLAPRCGWPAGRRARGCSRCGSACPSAR